MTVDQRLKLLDIAIDIVKTDPTSEWDDIVNTYDKLLNLITS